MNHITVHELKELMEHNAATVRLIDVRTVEEFVGGYIPGAVNIPVTSEDEEFTPHLATPVYVSCATDRRSTRVAMRLESLGAENVTVVVGGYLAWRIAGFPIER
jgi:phage shock protein E